ncbi:hypothetical protein GQF03_16450 [Sneathiella chungangensis]|uniref:Mandelate racemase/muconate lactonizing enzyme C-terminal domain-containing protein n=1 Tax=Sneathiella chungangensis TaxID=1418234 RepID=A0A845MLH5_9PROT|nr:enolase C-terminal domain-like protein [Sneathiella chungangensis]MZR23927.1 hypothetical protein [Sneathiella chungangensis]
MKSTTVFAESRKWTLADGESLHSVAVKIQLGQTVGHAECVPIPQLGEDIASTMDEIAEISPLIERGLTRSELNEIFPADSARNALDCALWDLESRQSKKTVWEILNVEKPPTVPLVTHLSSVEDLEKGQFENVSSIRLSALPEEIESRLIAIRSQSPNAELIVDGRKQWTKKNLISLDTLLSEFGVKLLLRPFSHYEDEQLTNLTLTTPVCAYEACNTRADLASIGNKYQGVVISLDKAGGLTEAFATVSLANKMGLKIVLEAAAASSRAAAPLLPLAPFADFVDLSCVQALTNDLPNGLKFSPPNHVSCITNGLWADHIAPANKE